MNLREQLLTVSEAYCRETGLSASRVSTLVFNDGKRLPAITAGGDLATGRFEHALRWFSDHWPADAAERWPDSIGRPEPQPIEAEAES